MLIGNNQYQKIITAQSVLQKWRSVPLMKNLSDKYTQHVLRNYKLMIYL